MLSSLLALNPFLLPFEQLSLNHRSLQMAASTQPGEIAVEPNLAATNVREIANPC